MFFEPVSGCSAVPDSSTLCTVRVLACLGFRVYSSTLIEAMNRALDIVDSRLGYGRMDALQALRQMRLHGGPGHHGTRAPCVHARNCWGPRGLESLITFFGAPVPYLVRAGARILDPYPLMLHGAGEAGCRAAPSRHKTVFDIH